MISDKNDVIEIDDFTLIEKMYYKRINKFIKNNLTKEQRIEMVNIINEESEVSLRILDWFVTKYSQNGIELTRPDNTLVNIYISYKSQLKTYKKKIFDPFRRSKRKFLYVYDGKKTIKTTLGQLNFFTWAFSNNIVDYVKNNLEFLNTEMIVSNKLEKEKKKNKTTKKTDNEDESCNSDDTSIIKFY